MRKFIDKRRKKFYLALFALLTMLIVLSGVAFYEFRTMDIKQNKYSELSSIAELKVSQIFYWREDKIGDAELLLKDPFFISTVDFYLRTRHKSDLTNIHYWMNSLIEHKGYSSICILDKNLKIRIGDSSMVLPDSGFFRSVLEEKKVVASDIYLLPDSDVVMDLYIPLRYNEVNTRNSIGIVVFRIKPQVYFDNTIISWPTNSKTSEIVLWRKDGDSLVFLTRLRHSDKKPLTQKFSIDDKELPVAKAVRGERGIVEGIDYNGVPVLADIREVPGTEWIVVSKSDLDEVFFPLKELTYIVIFIGFILTGTTALIITLLSRNQKASFYKKLLETELDKKALLKNFEFLTKYANDIILLTDKKGNITYSNEKASVVYGYSAEEMRKLNIKNLHTKSSPVDIDQIFLNAFEKEGLLYEAIHSRKDKSTFPVESSSRFIDIEGTVFFQSIIRDISDKKKADEQLYKMLKEKEILLKEVHHRVKNNLQTINSLLNLQGSTIEDERMKRFFLDAQNRIKSMALIHQELYNYDLANINSLKYLTELITHLVNTFEIVPERIKVVQNIEDKLIGIDLAIPLGLIITEILTNIFKHAFPNGRKGKIIIEFKEGKSGRLLRIKDDGIGLPKHLDIQNSTSLGMQLIFTLIDQIDGKVEVKNTSGTEFIIRYNESTTEPAEEPAVFTV